VQERVKGERERWQPMIGPDAFWLSDADKWALQVNIDSGACTGFPQLRSENSAFTKSDNGDRESAALR
jgi:hypothetical protein